MSVLVANVLRRACSHTPRSLWCSVRCRHSSPRPLRGPGAMEVHFLGTGSSHPTPSRGVSCIVLRHTTGNWMFDCGEGSQIQLMRSSVRPGRLNKIFITHLHGDHVFGLPGLLCTVSQNAAEDKPPVEIFGPVGLRKFLRVSLELSQSIIGFSYMVHELQQPEPSPTSVEKWEPDLYASGDLHPSELQGRTIMPNNHGHWEVCSESTLKVFAAPLKHRTTCFGYVIQEDEIPGKLDPTLLKAKGIPPGPLYASLKGGASVTAPDGTVIHPRDVIGPPRPGRKVVILGDTCDSSRIHSLAHGADVLVHEATNADELEEKAVSYGHSTPAMAGQFAHTIQAKRLVLTHFSQRYKGLKDVVEEGDESLEKLIQQARQKFSGDVQAAEDFTVVTVKQQRSKHKMDLSHPPANTSVIGLS